MATLFDTIQVRRGAAAAWTLANPVLAQGEWGEETDTGRMKIGDGLTHWISLVYYPSSYTSEWIQQSAIFTYISANQFSVIGNVTDSYPEGIRIQAIVSAGTIYGTVTSSVASSYPVTTTVTVQWDSGSLDTGLSAISIGIFSPINSSVPPQFFVTPGMIVEYGGDAAPTGWLLCYGQPISRDTYAALFNIIGTTFGSGNGSTTFNLPDFRGRVGIGPDNMGGGAAGRVAAATAAGYAAGAETLNVTHSHTTSEHTLTEAEIPAHSHAYLKSTYGVTYSSSDNNLDTHYGYTSTPTALTGGGGAHNHGSTGNGLGVKAIMQPYLAVNKIIKY